MQVSSVGVGDSVKAIDEKVFTLCSNLLNGRCLLDYLQVKDLVCDQFNVIIGLLIVGMQTLAVLRTVLEAKEVAEEAIKASGISYTIIRPGGLLSAVSRNLLTLALYKLVC